MFSFLASEPSKEFSVIHDHALFILFDNHQKQHKSISKMGRQIDDCRCSMGDCVRMQGLTYSLYHL